MIKKPIRGLLVKILTPNFTHKKGQIGVITQVGQRCFVVRTLKSGSWWYYNNNAVERHKTIPIKSVKSNTTHILKEYGIHGFYGPGAFTLCNKHLRTETFSPNPVIGKKCKFCFFVPHITFAPKSKQQLGLNYEKIKPIKKLKNWETIETFSIYEKDFKRYDIIPRIFTIIQSFLKKHNIPLENVYLAMSIKKRKYRSETLIDYPLVFVKKVKRKL